MRICCWTERYLPSIGGIEVLVSKLVRSLQPLGHDLIVVTSKDSLDLPDYQEFEGIPIHRFPFYQLASNRDITTLGSVRRRLSQLYKDFKPDVVHMHDVFAGSLFCIGTSEWAKPPLILTLHCDMSDLNCSEQTFFGRIVRSAKWITGCSAVVLERTRKAVPDIVPHSSVIYSGVEDSPIKPSPLPFDPPHILCLGRLRRGKGFDLALSALPLVQQRFPNVRMSISGGGPERSALQQLAADLALDSTVEFLGWADPESTNRNAIWELINTATMLLMPSRREGFWVEGFGMVAIEASIMQRPVIASRNGGLCEAVAHGQTGLLFDTDDVKDLIDAICQLLADPLLAAKMGRAGRLRSLDRFSWNNHVVSGYNDIYKKFAQEM